MGKSENTVPPWSACPFAAIPVRGQSTLNSLERIYTGPGLESLCRPSPWLAGRDCGPWLELSARFGNRRLCSIYNRSLSLTTSGRLASSISSPLTFRQLFPIGSDVIAEVFPVSRGTGVQSAHVKSRTSAVDNRQSPWNLWNFWPLATDPLGHNLDFYTNLHIAHGEIPRKFGGPGYHRVCADGRKRMFVADGRTDGFAIARTNIVLLGNNRQKLQKNNTN